ncbi:protease modulator HflC [Luteolibacter arcticus]|uniref:Protein HflC n=1 Tax=Luteolibacter arcticus TaxID=1581411 RepID=A0ABT3GGX4_9BACT|nr:protease modulator HflC [Luteolibacter arcticus]MCW1922518.1 protease modulator HflC [Luteolibacter arcticus]
MKRPVFILTLVGAFLAFLILSGSLYTVSETEQVFITEFGKPVGTPINADPAKNEAGLHFKKPFIQEINRIEKRILEWDGPATEMPTRDKLYVSVDNFARWRISDPKIYFEKLRDERSALSRLDDIIGSETRNVIASHDLIEVIRSDKDRKPVRDEALAAADSNLGVLPPIREGRAFLDQQILKAAAPKVRSWGIELIDIRFKRINYKPGVIEKIYARMASERQQIAERFRSEGAGEAAKILGRKERDLQQIDSEAYRTQQEIRGKADAEATGIYATAYNSSPSAAEFYQFMKTLETYQTLSKDTTAVFTTDSDLFRLLKRIDPKQE